MGQGGDSIDAGMSVLGQGGKWQCAVVTVCITSYPLSWVLHSGTEQHGLVPAIELVYFLVVQLHLLGSSTC